MKVIICNKIKEGSDIYFKRGWRIPFDELEKIGWISIAQTEINTKLSDFFIAKYGKIPDVILFWNTNTFIQEHLAEILGHPWIKCVYMDDLHQSSSKVKNYRNTLIDKFDYIFSTYAYTFTKFYPVKDLTKLIWYPHNVNNKFIVPFNETPHNRLLLSGSLDGNVYPFRHHLYTIRNKYPIDVLPQLSNRKANHQFYGHNYIKYLNKYIAAFVCCSNKNTPYIVSKFFEIPASGALMLAYDEFVKTPLKELGFIDGENYISVTYENFGEKIAFITDPAQKHVVDKIRKNGYDLVWQKHTLRDRINLIENITLSL